MMTVDEAASSLFVVVTDSVTEKVSRIAIPSDVQVGLIDKPQALDLFGRLSVATIDFSSTDENDGVLLASSDDTIIAVSNVITPPNGRLSIYLPSNPKNGQLHFVKDASGTAASIPIDVYAGAGAVIDELESKTIDTAFGSIAIFWFNSSWKTLVTGKGEAVVTGSSGPSTPPTELTASFLLATTPDAGMSGARTFVSSTNIQFTDSGPGSVFYVDLKDTSVTPGTYTNSTVTVDQKGRITTINSGSVSIDRLTRYLYVDPGHSTTTPDGSIVNPFKTLDQANDIIISGSTNSAWAVMLQTGYDYTCRYRNGFEAFLPYERTVAYVAHNPQRAAGVAWDTSIVGESSSYLYIYPTHDISFHNLAVGNTRQIGDGIVSFFNCYVKPFNRYNSYSPWSTVNGHTVKGFGTTFELLSWDGANDQTLNSNIELYNCHAKGEIRANALYSVGTLLGDFSSVNISIYAYLMLQSCRIAASTGQITVQGAGVSNLRLIVDEATRVQLDQSNVTYPEEGFTNTFVTHGVTRYDINPENFILTNNPNWPCSASAEIEYVDFMPALAFSSSLRQGVGIGFDVPAGKTTATFEFWYMTPTASLGGGFEIALANRFLTYSSSLMTSWSTFSNIQTLAMETNERWRRKRVKLAFSSTKFSDRSYQFIQLIRNTDAATDTNTSKLFIRNIGIELT